MIIRALAWMLAIFLLTVLTVRLSQADEPEVEKENTHSCINVRVLKRTLVVDDQRIIFVMLGKTSYLNILPRSCNGLARERRFSYATSGRRLCSFDTIRVLRGSSGVLDQGKLCRLGPFIPITRESIVTLIQKSRARPQAKPPSLPDAEVVVEESDDSSDAPAETEQ